MKLKNVTVREIAKEAGVSAASVSRTLNGIGGVGEETRNKILEVCERLGYIPNTLARGLVLNDTKTIGIIVPDIQSPFYTRLMELAALEAKAHGYQVIMCVSFRDYETEVNYFNLLISHQVDGILYFPVGEKSGLYTKQFLRYVPIVSLNMMNEEGIPFVATDEFSAGTLATDYMISCGCKKLAYIGYTTGIAYEERIKGFLSSIEGADIEGIVFDSGMNAHGGFDKGYIEFSAYWNKYRSLPDGIIASSDQAARGVIKACMERNISIPENMSLIAFDNIESDLSLFKITSVSASHEQHVKKAFELLMKIKDKATLTNEEKRILIQPGVFPKDSCKNTSSLRYV